ncbi:PDC sensor domain-containing protein [Actibacterium sp. 188UL27-1]|uniref:type IV pili methyl-accepting chemotaxis transducer N-terminal domain-containing protein n=1 Tax=Actibacterium sp. 188UL27-1 TaxID=2786961 RepID=UPI00195798EF|nr:PDC sensor domain-containing protein [Actibacterium sp. 188UL27-1]MBM7068143.1 type IV pili methyl-accepting chemotaxis transducer N-terminal domain-containing protein [Actibacterium sp. 188UL27-1]
MMKRDAGILGPFATRSIKATLLCSALVVGFTFVGPTLSSGKMSQAMAQGLEEGGRARINAAEQLAILGQKLAAAACSIDLGYNVAEEKEVLRDAHDDFIRMLDALEFGNQRVGIPTPETYRKAKIALNDIRTLWGPMDKAAMAMLDDNPAPEHAKLIAQTNQQLLKDTEKLASIILNEYANPFDLVLADALAINIAERQEIFSQKLKREACEIAGGHADNAIKADFVLTIGLFEKSLVALRDGFPDAGIRPPPNDEIRYQLDRAWEEWKIAQPVFASITDKNHLSEEEMKQVSTLSEVLDKRMHTIVVEYLLTAPGASDLIDIPLTAYAEAVLMEWTTTPQIVDALRSHNSENQGVNMDTLQLLQAQWVSETADQAGPLLDKVTANPASDLLKSKKNQSADMITEIVLIDRNGIVVAESEPTPHYVHVGEPRWDSVATTNADNIYISGVHLEEGGHVYQAEVALPVYDPDSGDRIGVMAFGINVQSMF